MICGAAYSQAVRRHRLDDMWRKLGELLAAVCLTASVLGLPMAFVWFFRATLHPKSEATDRQMIREARNQGRGYWPHSTLLSERGVALRRQGWGLLRVAVAAFAAYLVLSMLLQG
jgi:hypothetical protein